MSILLKSKEPIAKKNHKCMWCNLRIAKGDRYVYQVGIQNGDFFAAKWHFKCVEDMPNADG